MSLKSRAHSFCMGDNSTSTFNLTIPLKDGTLYDFVFNLPINNEKENGHKDYATLERIKVIPFDDTKKSRSRRKLKSERRACNLASHQFNEMSCVD